MGVQQQYDGIGEAFEGFKALPMIRYGEVPSVLELVGDVTGKTILDLACGTGFYSREFKRRGAAEVLGVDISGEMISVAQERERREPLGVRYEVGDVAELRPLEQRFDLALAVQCLNYARTRAEMQQMCATIHRSLVPGGEFFLLGQKPDYRFDCLSLEKYGFRCEPMGEEIETGPRVQVTALLAPQPISIVGAVPRREVYEECLRTAGFSAVEWVPLKVSKDGVREFGEEFWADLLAHPPLELLRCRA
ncbi:class I SAM-dependent methyltransferase [Streptomyces sp. RS10V-4]|uniref:class I SAM-dependent methyltransferase n=1 Tax=Streptomyces rhizoryzae TaxID=2932493 RepID=UPI0020030BC8|nr:class I SAM-dependent methyltransferase [Streptomyces rhizoryzae]MCK7621790.1 class I SAM-dependent methyltransferase [Streptomyces rhizoryzae]